VHGVTFKLLKYADDVVILSDTVGGLRHSLARILDWCDAWGMDLGLGMGKTEAMAFHPPRSARPQLPPLTPAASHPLPVRLRGTRVQWTREYRYLGYPLRDDLDSSGLFGKMVASLSKNWNRYFVANPLARRASPAFATQLYRTVVLGSANYLLALTEPTQKVLNALDAHTRAVERDIVNLHRGAVTAMVQAEGRLPLAAGIMARERSRLAGKLAWQGDTSIPRHLHPTYGTIAGRLYHAIMAVPQERRTGGRSGSWFWRIEQLEQQTQQQLGVPPPARPKHPVPAWPLHPKVTAERAAVYGREVGLAAYRKAARAELQQAGVACPPPSPTTPCPSTPPSAVAAWFNLGYAALSPGPGTLKAATPMSVRGPGCSGGFLATTTELLPAGHRLALSNVRLGRLGMLMTPLAPDHLRRAHAVEEARAEHGLAPGTRAPAAARRQLNRADAVRAWNALVNTPRSCGKCGDPGSDEGPFHVCTECMHTATREARAEVISSVPTLAYKLAYRASLALARHREDPAAVAEATLAGSAAQQAAETTDWSLPESRYVLFRLLTAAPWPACIFDGYPHGQLGKALGRAFDTTAKPHRTRPVIDALVAWAALRLRTLFDAWHGTA
jgi:hypothetical protein